MRERIVTLCCAAGALFLFYAFLIGNRTPDSGPISRPVSTEPGPNGYLALRRWLAAQGVDVVPLLARFDSLVPADEVHWSRGNVLVTTLPDRRAVRWREAEDLKQWISAGNTLFVVAGVLDTPEWSFEARSPYALGFEVLQSFEMLTGLVLKPCSAASVTDADSDATDSAATEGDDARRAPQLVALPPEPLESPKRSILQPNGAHPYLGDVHVVHALSEYPADAFCLGPLSTMGVLSLMHDDTQVPALWARRMGEGWIIASGYGSLLTNKLLGEADNARLFANILRVHLQPGGRVYLDDLHQGAPSVYDAAAFYGDPRLHATFWWIIGLWLVYVLGSSKLHAAPATQEAVEESELTLAIGHLIARKLDDRRAAERLFRHFFERIDALRGPDDRTPVWSWLRETTRIGPGTIERAERMHARLEQGRRIDLIELQNALCALRREL